jgi:hypothetical protein
MPCRRRTIKLHPDRMAPVARNQLRYALRLTRSPIPSHLRNSLKSVPLLASPRVPNHLVAQDSRASIPGTVLPPEAPHPRRDISEGLYLLSTARRPTMFFWTTPCRLKSRKASKKYWTKVSKAHGRRVALVASLIGTCDRIPSSQATEKVFPARKGECCYVLSVKDSTE